MKSINFSWLIKKGFFALFLLVIFLSFFLINKVASPQIETAQAQSTPTFSDVPVTHPFYWQIEAIYREKITSGCAANPLKYCPDSLVTRGAMAAFLIKAMKQNPVSPCQGVFADVPTSHSLCGSIEKISQLGITSGCSIDPATKKSNYCPDTAVTRGQMAVFLEKAIGGLPYNNPTPTFADVPVTHPFYQYIEAMYRDKITSGCSIDPATKKPNYCPTNQVTRAQMAAFIVAAFKIPYGQGKIQGYVTHTKLDGKKEYMAGVNVYYRKNNQDTLLATTSATGYYISGTLPAGTYTLIAKKDGYDLKNQVATTIQSNGQTVWADNLVLVKRGGIQGYVKDETGNFLSDANVTIEKSDASWKSTANSDATGYYVFNNLKPADSFVLRATKGNNYIYTNTVTGTIQAEIIIWADDLILHQLVSDEAAATGTVKDSTGALMAGSIIIFNEPADTTTTDTTDQSVITDYFDPPWDFALIDSTGQYEIDSLPEDVYAISVLTPNDVDYCFNDYNQAFTTLTQGQFSQANFSNLIPCDQVQFPDTSQTSQNSSKNLLISKAQAASTGGSLYSYQFRTKVDNYLHSVLFQRYGINPGIILGRIKGLMARLDRSNYFSTTSWKDRVNFLKTASKRPPEFQALANFENSNRYVVIPANANWTSSKNAVTNFGINNGKMTLDAYTFFYSAFQNAKDNCSPGKSPDDAFTTKSCWRTEGEGPILKAFYANYANAANRTKNGFTQKEIQGLTKLSQFIHQVSAEKLAQNLTDGVDIERTYVYLLISGVALTLNPGAISGGGATEGALIQRATTKALAKADITAGRVAARSGLSKVAVETARPIVQESSPLGNIVEIDLSKLEDLQIAYKGKSFPLHPSLTEKQLFIEDLFQSHRAIYEKYSRFFPGELKSQGGIDPPTYLKYQITLDGPYYDPLKKILNFRYEDHFAGFSDWARYLSKNRMIMHHESGHAWEGGALMATGKTPTTFTGLSESALEWILKNDFPEVMANRKYPTTIFYKQMVQRLNKRGLNGYELTGRLLFGGEDPLIIDQALGKPFVSDFDTALRNYLVEEKRCRVVTVGYYDIRLLQQAEINIERLLDSM